jgi:hypothetical protein
MLTRASTVAFLETRMMRRPQLLAASVFLLAALVAPARAQWTPPVNITRLPAGFTAYNPSLAIDSTGTLHASWSLRLSNEFDWIDYSTKPVDSDTWLTPVHVSRDSFPYRSSAVVIGPGGQPHVLWQSEGQNGHLYISHKSGDTWSTPERLTSWNRSGFAIRACADRQYRIHAVWGDLDLHTIWYARYDDSGWHGPEAAVSDPGEMARPDVAADREGYAHVVYQPPGTPTGCGYVRQTVSGWSEPATIPGLTRDAMNPCVALDTGDYPQVCWGYDPTVYSGWTGDTWSAPQRLDSAGGEYPAICSDSFGQVHIVFCQAGVGMTEVTAERGERLSWMPVGSYRLQCEMAAQRDRLHMVSRYGSPDVQYSSRELWPPAVCESPPHAARASLSLRATIAGRSLVVTMVTPAPVLLEVVDVAGRLVGRRPLGRLDAGDHDIEVGTMIAEAGVYFCRITSEYGAASAKLIRP